ncbi:MAG: hypothetical protein WBA84_05060 [Carnobacterium sp.]|uniref:hypothetical protein n=1 Tax=Carnobacterium sp. TaxID=48221 RepID=UPI003C710E52
MKKMNTYYWAIGITIAILMGRQIPVVYAENNNLVDSEIIKESELIQSESSILADIYENTLIYNSKVEPESKVSLTIKGQEEKKINIPVATNGRFIINFSLYRIEVGDKLIFNVSKKIKENEYKEEQILKEVLEKKVGAEIILYQENSLQEDEMLKATNVSEIYTHSKEIRGKTMLGTEIYLVSEGEVNKPIYPDDVTGKFNWVFDENQIESYEGKKFQFVFISNGIMTVLDKTVLKPTKEWEMRVEEIRKATKLPDIFQGMLNYEGKTLPNAIIKGFYLNELLFEVVSDKDGNFTVNGKVLSDIPLGDSLTLMIVDRKGVYLSIKKEILPKKEEVEEVEKKPGLDTGKDENLREEQTNSKENPSIPLVKDDQDEIVVYLPTQSKEPDLQEKTELKDGSADVVPESNLSGANTFLSSTPEETINEANKVRETKKVEGSDFAVLATIVLIGTAAMSGLLYKY